MSRQRRSQSADASRRAEFRRQAALSPWERMMEHGLESALIGAMACAVHGYSRATEDVDLAVYADPTVTLPAVVRSLTQLGHEIDFQRPDAEDPWAV